MYIPEKQFDVFELERMPLAALWNIALYYEIIPSPANKGRVALAREILNAQCKHKSEIDNGTMAGTNGVFHSSPIGTEIGAHNLDGCMRTYTGKHFDLINPLPEMIDIRDIAQGLAYKAHFAGQSKHYFSIAQHCLLVCDLLPESFQKNNRMMMMALLHDASEAYIGDMIKPLKVYLPAFVLVEDKIMKAVVKKFRLDDRLMKEIKPYDIQAQQIEYDNFYNGAKTINYLSPEEAVKNFKLRYIRYFYS